MTDGHERSKDFLDPAEIDQLFDAWRFVSERGHEMTRQAVNYIIKTAGERAGLGHVHPHMLRHSCGYYLANKGVDFRITQDFLGHRQLCCFKVRRAGVLRSWH